MAASVSFTSPQMNWDAPDPVTAFGKFKQKCQLMFKSVHKETDDERNLATFYSALATEFPCLTRARGTKTGRGGAAQSTDHSRQSHKHLFLVTERRLTHAERAWGTMRKSHVYATHREIACQSFVSRVKSSSWLTRGKPAKEGSATRVARPRREARSQGTRVGPPPRNNRDTDLIRAQYSDDKVQARHTLRLTPRTRDDSRSSRREAATPTKR
ncbi:hypothetical protein ACROYT_G019141 [Oculina patagonica]